MPVSRCTHALVAWNGRPPVLYVFKEGFTKDFFPPEADVFQLGLVAYETLAGARPFTPDERERLRSGDPVSLPTRGSWAAVPEARPVEYRRDFYGEVPVAPGDRLPGVPRHLLKAGTRIPVAERFVLGA